MNFLVLVLFVLLEKIIPIFPIGFLYRLARLKSKFFYYFLPVRKKTARINLKMAFPEKTIGEINEIIKECYLNILIVIVEFFYMRKFTNEQLSKKFVIVNSGIMKKKFEIGKGIVFVSGHFGNWEIMAYGGTLAMGIPLDIIVKEQTNKAIDRRINSVRVSGGNRMIEMKKSGREVMKALSENRFVAMLGDQSAPAESVRVKFFGMDITAFEGAAAFALKTGAPVFFGVPVRDENYNYSLEAVEINTAVYNGYNTANIQQMTQEIISLLEDKIRRYPGHWLWFHRRFKSVISYG